MLGRAIARGWDAAVSAATARDREALEAVQALASQLEERAGGGEREEAHRLTAYCSACLDDLRAGIWHDSFLWRLFSRP